MDHGRISDMMKATASLRDQYQAAWREEYTNYALGVMLAHFDAELEFWRQFAQRLWDTANTFEDGDTLPTLEELRPHW